jgi:hypothetical protein
MKKKVRKKLLKRSVDACYLAGKLVLLGAVIAFFVVQFDTVRMTFVVQFDTVRMTFVRAVAQEALGHCPRVEARPNSLPDGVLETVYQDTPARHRNEPA